MMGAPPCTPQAEHEQLAAAPAVVVVGGGSLGVELAGEVLTGGPGVGALGGRAGRAGEEAFERMKAFRPERSDTAPWSRRLILARGAS